MHSRTLAARASKTTMLPIVSKDFVVRQFFSVEFLHANFACATYYIRIFDDFFFFFCLFKVVRYSNATV